MTTLLLRLSAPLQSWGTQSNFTNRDTGREPSKSGVVGLLCAALGRPRTEPVTDLAGLKMGVRIDQEGVIRSDYHTAGRGGIFKVSGDLERRNLIVSQRFYLSDARFLVGLEGDSSLLEMLQRALQQPRWFLFLGRKSCIPAERVWLPDGLVDGDLQTALRSYPWIGSGTKQPRVRGMIDDPNGTIIRNDLPISFAPPRFMARTLRTFFVDFDQGGEDVSITVDA